MALEAAVTAIAESGAPVAAPAPALSAETQRLLATDANRLDAELLEIFLIEATEVLDTVVENRAQLARNPGDREALRSARRQFHTIKGSGRMVGLNELGELAYDVEKIHNRLLEEDRDVTPAMLELLDVAEANFRAVGRGAPGHRRRLRRSRGALRRHRPRRSGAAGRIRCGCGAAVPAPTGCAVAAAAKPTRCRTPRVVARRAEAPSPERSRFDRRARVVASSCRCRAAPSRLGAEPAAVVPSCRSGRVGTSLDPELEAEARGGRCTRGRVVARSDVGTGGLGRRGDRRCRRRRRDHRVCAGRRDARRCRCRRRRSAAARHRHRRRRGDAGGALSRFSSTRRRSISRRSGTSSRCCSSIRGNCRPAAMVRASHTLCGIHRAGGFPLIALTAGALEQCLLALQPLPPPLPTEALPALADAIGGLGEFLARVKERRSFNATDVAIAAEIQQELDAVRRMARAPVPARKCRRRSRRRCRVRSSESRGGCAEVRRAQMRGASSRGEAVAVAGSGSASRSTRSVRPMRSDGSRARSGAGRKPASRSRKRSRRRKRSRSGSGSCGRSTAAASADAKAAVAEPEELLRATRRDAAAGATHESRRRAPHAARSRRIRWPTFATTSTRRCCRSFSRRRRSSIRRPASSVRAWRRAPGDDARSRQLRRTLHTFKGSARMAGAMRLGELVHLMESRLDVDDAPVPGSRRAVRGARRRSRPHRVRARRVARRQDQRRRCRGPDRDEAAAGGGSARGRRRRRRPPLRGTHGGRIAADARPRAAARGGRCRRRRGAARARCCAFAPTSSTGWSTRPAKWRSRGRASKASLRALKANLLELTGSVIRLRTQVREIEIQAESQIQSRLMQVGRGRGGIRSARIRSVHALPGAGALAGRGRQRRFDGPAVAAEEPRRRRRRADRAGQARARRAAAAVLDSHGAVRQPVRAPVPDPARNGARARQARQSRNPRRADRARPRGAGKARRAARAPAAQRARPRHRSPRASESKAGKSETGEITLTVRQVAQRNRDRARRRRRGTQSRRGQGEGGGAGPDRRRCAAERRAAHRVHLPAGILDRVEGHAGLGARHRHGRRALRDHGARRPRRGVDASRDTARRSSCICRSRWRWRRR